MKVSPPNLVLYSLYLGVARVLIGCLILFLCFELFGEYLFVSLRFHVLLLLFLLILVF